MESLRLTARLHGGYLPPFFYPEAGVVHPCPAHPQSCTLAADGTLAPVEDLTRFADPGDAPLTMVVYQYGPWPRRAWLSGRTVGNDYADVIFEWTEAGWAEKMLFEDGYEHLGMGGWSGGRVIAPIIRLHAIKDDPDDPAADFETKYIEPPRFVVVSGPPSDDLPAITQDVAFSPAAFASFPTGHAFLVGERDGEGDGYKLFVQRWSPGDRRSREDTIDNFALPPRDLPGSLRNPTKIMLASAPDDVYVGGIGSRSGEERGHAAIAHFDGRAWGVSYLPTAEKPVIAMARGPDGVIWLISGSLVAPAGELWRKPPGREFEKIELPQAHADHAPIEAVPLDIWPRKASEIWLIAAFRPRGATKDTRYEHGVFLLRPPALGSAPR